MNKEKPIDIILILMGIPIFVFSIVGIPWVTFQSLHGVSLPSWAWPFFGYTCIWSAVYVFVLLGRRKEVME